MSVNCIMSDYSKTPGLPIEAGNVSPPGEGGGGYRPPFYKSPIYVGVVVKALEGREERQGLDLRRWMHACMHFMSETLTSQYPPSSVMGLHPPIQS